MVGVFASLKWRLVRNRVSRSSSTVRVWMIVGWVALLLVLALLLTGLVALRGNHGVALQVVTMLFTIQFVSWGLAPVVAFGVDETVDPARFALLPLSTRTLQRGLLVTALIGYLPMINTVLLIGCAIAVSQYWWQLPVALLCAAVQLLMCVTFSRALSTALSSLMSGRRGRDIGVMAGFGVFVLYFGASMLLNLGGSGADKGASIGTGFGKVADAVGWGPPGTLAHVPDLLARGMWARLLVGLIIVVATFGVLWWWWGVSLRRSLTTIPSTSSASAPGRESDGRAVATDTRGTVALVAARDRLLAWRDPMRRVPWLIALVLTVGWPFLVFRHGGAVFGVGLGAALTGIQSGNSYAMEGSGIWLHMVAFADRARARGELLGHAFFVLIPGTVIIAAATAIIATVKHEWHLVPGGLGVSLAALLGASATAAVLSAVLPYAMRQSRQSMFANSVPGQKGRTTGASLGVLAGAVVIAAPSIVLGLLSIDHPVLGWVGLAVGLGLGGTALVIGTRIGAARYTESIPEILAIVSAGDRL